MKSSERIQLALIKQAFASEYLDFEKSAARGEKLTKFFSGVASDSSEYAAKLERMNRLKGVHSKMNADSAAKKMNEAYSTVLPQQGRLRGFFGGALGKAKNFAAKRPGMTGAIAGIGGMEAANQLYRIPNAQADASATTAAQIAQAYQQRFQDQNFLVRGLSSLFGADPSNFAAQVGAGLSAYNPEVGKRYRRQLGLE